MANSLWQKEFSEKEKRHRLDRDIDDSYLAV